MQVALCLLIGSLAAPVIRAADPASAPGAPRTSAKILTVGNSFADNAATFLPDLAKAGGKQLICYRADLPGHSLKQHAGYIEAYEANPGDPKGSPYKNEVTTKTLGDGWWGCQANPSALQKSNCSLQEMLGCEPWDYVTIQQFSGESFKPESYEPYAKTIVDCIRKNALKAEILVLETWAYPDDYYDKFHYTDAEKASDNPGKNPKAMYTCLKAAYGKLAHDMGGLRTIPIGDAFQAVRTLPNTFSINRPNDKHANEAGQYLGGCVLYEVIYGESVENNSFVPKNMPPEQAKLLRQIAHQAVAARKTVTP